MSWVGVFDDQTCETCREHQGRTDDAPAPACTNEKGCRCFKLDPHEIRDWYFTFGYGHVHPRTGERLGGCYIILRGTLEGTRTRMFKLFGAKWSRQYHSAEQAGVERWGLRLVDE